jgi:hypothetical protein
MEWVNAVVLLGLLVFALQQKKRLRRLEEDLPLRKGKLPSQGDMMPSHKEILASYREILASHREILASEKEILDSHKAMLESLKSYGGIPTPAESAGGPGVAHEGVHLRKRQEMAEEKSRKNKNHGVVRQGIFRGFGCPSRTIAVCSTGCTGLHHKQDA